MKSRLYKHIVSVLFGLLIMFSFVSPASRGLYISMPVNTSKESINEGTTRGEEIKYYYRVYNGHLQYRIWSITYGRWITEWTNC